MQRAHLALLAFASASLAACSSSSGGGSTPADDVGADVTPDTTPVWKGPDVEVTCTDTLAAIDQAPTTLPATKGAIVKCARDADLSAATMTAHLASYGYTGKALTSGAHVYRVQYRTERGDAAHTAGFSSAIVFLPDTPRAAKVPVIVGSHGSRGQAAKCAIYRQSAAEDDVYADFERQVLPFVGAGYAVIAPDLAGYAGYGSAGNPPSAYAASDDVGRSTLDGARALKLLAPSILSDKVVITGHSQGGHTAFSALAMAETYASELNIAAVATFSPLWIPQRSWGTILLAPSLYPLSGDTVTANAVSVWYHYTHGELLDGPGHGVDVFAAGKRAAIKAWVDSQCWAGSGWTELSKLGSNSGDLFDPTFVAAIGDKASGNAADCPTAEPAKTLCNTWMTRYLGDRPHLTGKAKTVPIRVFYGSKDTTIPPDRVSCALDRLKSDGANYKVCVDSTSDHSTIVSTKGSFAADWVASLTLGEADPGSCGKDETAIVDPLGAPAVCNGLPPND
jgi:pimeloyl-ACP methyl ester carboxylesterase